MHFGDIMTFKANWEKADKQHLLPTGHPEKMVKLAYPNKTLSSYKLISGGCANLNIKFQLEHDERPLMLRIYLRDKEAAFREQKLGALLKPTIPAPLIYYIGKYQEYCFSITEFLPGITLRDLFLGNEPHDVAAIIYEVGILTSKIAFHQFPLAGFFDKDLNIIETTSKEDYLIFANECLQNQVVLSQITSNMLSKINYYLDKYRDLFPGENEKHLVHADFDPTNILVDNVNDTWKITGVLDWEFSFSGSPLWDVANMLRYAHKMPPQFESSFLMGLKNNGVSLPDNWRITISLLNLISLLDCLKRSDPKNCPKRCTDIVELISHILRTLDVS